MLWQKQPDRHLILCWSTGETLVVKLSGWRVSIAERVPLSSSRYKDGQDHMGEHRDDEKELDPLCPIASVSLGVARDFIFRHRDTRGNQARRQIEPVKLELAHGSLLLMNSPTNTFWYHSLPVRKRISQPRINLTFRRILKDTKKWPSVDYQQDNAEETSHKGAPMEDKSLDTRTNNTNLTHAPAESDSVTARGETWGHVDWDSELNTKQTWPTVK